MSLKQELRKALSIELSRHTKEDPELVLNKLQTPKNPAHGDISYPAFEFAKGEGLPPPVATEQLKNTVKLPSGFESASATGPFLNFRLAQNQFVARYLSEKQSILKPNAGKIVLEFSSPNIAKPFHVGHLRVTVIGNSLDKIYRYLGYDVVSVNHLGDWGTQFGFVWAGCKLWGKPENPTVSELVELYKKATKQKEDEEKHPEEPQTVNEIAREYFRDLEEGKDYAVEFWKWCLEVSMRYFTKTYERLNVHFDHYTGESFYSDKLDDVKKILTSAGILQESKGALGVDLGEELGFARMATPDGRSLYLTRDIATAKYRAETFKFDRAIYVVGAPQTLHFNQIKGVLNALGVDYASKIEHVAFGTVLGMKTRGDGEIIELNDFLDEAVSRARVAYHEAVEKRPAGVDEEKVAEAVGMAAILFSTLNRQRMKDVQFSWENAMAFSGDSGPYLLYAVARITGIEEKAKEAGISPATKVDAEQFNEPEAFKLGSLLDEFVPTLERVVRDNEPAYLSAYALELSFAFSKAYQALRVIDEDPAIAGARLLLFRKTKEVLSKSLELLGMKVVERM